MPFRRLVLLAAASTAVVAAVPPATADSTFTVKDSGGTTYEAPVQAGSWQFTVTAITGRPSQVYVKILPAAGGDPVAYAFIGNPRVGRTFSTYAGVPDRGAYVVSARMLGGNVKPEDSVTLDVDTP